MKMLIKWKNRNIKPLDDEQRLLHEIVSKMCSKPESKFLMSPGTSFSRYYIENKNHEYFIVLDDEAIKITNHSFYLVRHFHADQMKSLIEKVRRRIESDRVKMEKDMFKNELDLLRNISFSLDKIIK
jgi:hypothetical protein